MQKLADLVTKRKQPLPPPDQSTGRDAELIVIDTPIILWEFPSLPAKIVEPGERVVEPTEPLWLMVRCHVEDNEPIVYVAFGTPNQVVHTEQHHDHLLAIGKRCVTEHDKPPSPNPLWSSRKPPGWPIVRIDIPLRPRLLSAKPADSFDYCGPGLLATINQSSMMVTLLCLRGWCGGRTASVIWQTYPCHHRAFGPSFAARDRHPRAATDNRERPPPGWYTPNRD